MKILSYLGKTLLSISVPVLILMTTIRLLLTPFVVEFEYTRPGFPPDSYGFTLQDRLKYARISLDYLNNNEGIDFLQQVNLTSGEPLYNERELSHMLDVKVLIQSMTSSLSILLVIVAIAGLASWKMGGFKSFLRAISDGGWLTVGLIILVLAGVALSFNWLFTRFHELFFTGDTWLFYYTDSLIRLFPMQFWQDMFIYLGLLSIVIAILIGLIGRWLSEEKQKTGG